MNDPQPLEEELTRLARVTDGAELPREIAERMRGHLDKFREDLPEHAYTRSLGSVAASRPGGRLIFKIGLVAAGLIVVLVAVIQLTRPAPAGAQTIQALADVKTMICEITIETDGRVTQHHTIYWQAPDTIRVDWGKYMGEGIEETVWIQSNRVTTLTHEGPYASVVENMPRKSEPLREMVRATATPGGLMEAFKSDNSEITETLERDDVILIRYEIARREGWPPDEILVNAVTHLPAEARSSTPRYSEGEIVSWITSVQRFRWNLPLAPGLLVPNLPEGVVAHVIDGSKDAIPHVILPGIGVGPIRLGMSREQIEALWGKPDIVHNDTFLNYFEHGVQLMMSNKRGLVAISCNLDDAIGGSFKTFSGTTAEGVGIGSTEEEIIAALGEPDLRETRALKAQPPRASHTYLNYDSGIQFDVYPWLKEERNGEPRVISISVR